MAKGMYIGVDSKARKAKKMYIGVDGKARKIKKMYIGVDGKARLFYISTISTLSRHGQITSLWNYRNTLSALHIGNYAIFGGGINDQYMYRTIDVYDTSLTHFHNSATTGTGALAAGRRYMTTTNVGDYGIFAGGFKSDSTSSSVVDTYTPTLTKSTATELSTSRGALAGANVGNYAVFAGGLANMSDASSANLTSVESYNTSLTKGSVSALSVGRSYFDATSVGNYALFGGGSDSAVVDTYNTSLTKGTATNMSTGRTFVEAVTVGGYALFGGGGGDGSQTSVVDVYNQSLTKGANLALSVARNKHAATKLGDYAIFGGGFTGTGSSVVESFDESLTRTILPNLVAVASALAATYVGDYALFGGGYTSNVGYSDKVTAYKITYSEV